MNFLKELTNGKLIKILSWGLALLLFSLYFWEMYWIFVDNGDLGPRTLTLGAVVSLLLVIGLLFSTTNKPKRRWQKAVIFVMLLPSFILGPVLAASIHILVSILIFVFTSLAGIFLIKQSKELT